MAEQLKKPKARSRKIDVASRTIKSRESTTFSNIQNKYEKEFKPPERVSVWDMVNHMKRDPNVLIDATVCGYKINKNGIRTLETKRITDRNKFLDLFDKTQVKFREGGFGSDFFGTDGSPASGNNFIGDDFIPLLGGPFNKQLYLHDMLEQQALAFFAYHHDALAHRFIHILRDFTLGKGWGTKCEDEQKHGVWQAFEKANKLQDLFRYLAIELSIYGEIMLWWLPNHETKIQWDLRPSQEAPKGLLPRVRLLDPSMVWEIVTYPEDITRVLYYQVVSPTQYQIYTGKDKSGEYVPTLKYIFQQIPADQIQHYKVNGVSNEKRGRSDLYPIFGDLKRYRDTLDYSIVAAQKAAAWAIDTTIEGAQSDLDAYVASQEALGSIAPAGSEFVHTSKVTREYQSNAAMGKGGGGNFTVDAIRAKCCIGFGLPEHYLGIIGHGAGGGSTRAGAIVAAEPVAKLFEMRQQIFINILTEMEEKLCDQMGIKSPAEMEFIFPEIITQDRSAKLKDIAICETQNWFSNETAATLAAKEMGYDTFQYDIEKKKILYGGPVPVAKAPPAAAAPLSSPGLSSSQPSKPKTTFDSTDKAKVRNNLGY